VLSNRQEMWLRQTLGRRILQPLERVIVLFAWAWRRVLRGTTFVVVAGSVGKTTGKEMVAAVLAQQGRTYASIANQNAGLVVALRTMKSKRGDTIAFVTLDDRTSRMEVSVFGEVYERYRNILMKDAVLVIEGEVSNDDYSGSLKVRAKNLYDMGMARIAFAKELVIRVNQDNCQQVNQQLASLLAPYRSEGCPCVLEYTAPTAHARLPLSADWRVTPSDELLLSLQESLGDKRVELSY